MQPTRYYFAYLPQRHISTRLSQNACYVPSFQRTRIRLQRRVASNLQFVCAMFRDETGGASRDRTDDPLLAKQVLSQLSYGPKGYRVESPTAPPRSRGFW